MSLEQVKCAFKKRIYCGKINNINNVLDPEVFLNIVKSVLVVKIGEFFQIYRTGIKVQFELSCDYLVKKGNLEKYVSINQKTTMERLTFSTDFNSWYKEHVIQCLLRKMEEFQELESVKALNRIFHLQVSL